MLRLLVLVLVAVAVRAYPRFRDQIPNGHNVPNPCKKSGQEPLWQGVGHQNINGGGVTNPFGADFMAAGNNFTKALCQKDSDGDGRTNGQELGDPGCVWTVGQKPQQAPIGHPGICEPLDDPKCASSWFKC